MENIGDIEIFGNDSVGRRTSHRGCHITTNLKNSNTYLSRDLCKMIFGSDKEEGRINIVHSKIENNWYVAVSPGKLFDNGYECVANEKAKDCVFRVKGVASIMPKIVQSLTGCTEQKRYVLNVSSDHVEYDGMKLYQITIQN